MPYDKRMNPFDNLRFGVVLPAICKVRGHKWHCFKLVPTDPQEWFYWCKRCMEMTEDKLEPCGSCTNGCRDYSG